MWGYVFQFTHSSDDDCENVRTRVYFCYHHQIGSMTHLSLFRVMSGNNGMCCMSFYVLMNLWYVRVTSWDICGLVFLPRIWSPVTDIQQYYLSTLLMMAPSKYVFTCILFHGCVSERVVSSVMTCSLLDYQWLGALAICILLKYISD